MEDAAQRLDSAKKAKDYKAHRLSIAPMMDWTAVVGKSHKVKCLQA